MSSKLLPSGWVNAIVGDYLFLKNGYAFKSKDYVAASSRSFPVIRISDLNGNEATDENSVHVLNGADGFEVRKNDLLIAMSGATTGKVGIYNGIEPAYQNQRVGNIKLHSEIYGDSKYRNYLVLALSKKILDIAYGGAQPNISGKGIESIEIALPPLAEQKVIAEKLDTLLAQVETTKARLESTLETLKQFRQSVLAAAVSGKLTDIDDFKIEPLDKLIEEMRNGLSPKPNEDGLGYPILRISSVRAMEVDTSDVRYLECDKLTRERYALKEDDLLFTRYNGSLDFVGVCGLFKVCKHETLLYPDKLIRVRTNTSKLLPKFAEIYFSSPEIRTLVTNFVKSTSGQKGISGKDLKSVVVKYPTTDEQIKIIDIVEKLFGGADATEQKVNQALERVNNLTQSILATAFRGELTEQWRKENPELISGDNSAEALLTKIKAEREALKPKRKTNK